MILFHTIASTIASFMFTRGKVFHTLSRRMYKRPRVSVISTDMARLTYLCILRDPLISRQICKQLD